MNTSEQRVSENIGSIEALCEEAICTANLELMVALGFPKEISGVLCETIRSKAAEIGVHDLESHYQTSQVSGGPTIINRLMRAFHRVYLSSRSRLHPSVLLDYMGTKDKDICLLVLQQALRRSEGMMEVRHTARSRKKAARLECESLVAEDE